jgi:hypothetical protein
MIFLSENLLERHKKRGLMDGVYGKKLIIEYYEPDALKEKEDIVIKRISYTFVGFGNKRISSYHEPKLKSGFWGSSEYLGCQKDVICSEIGNYQNGAKSVVYLDIEFKIDEDGDGYFERHHYRGTGFFLNKVGGYNSSDNPLLATSGHLYCYEKFDGATIDIISDISKFTVVTRYQNLECGIDDTQRGGIRLPDNFNRIALGSSYNEAELPWYSPNEDYALLQAGSNVNQLSSYDLVYGAWSNSHDFNSSSNVGYFCIHHPKGDVKKINKDNDRADVVTFDGFQLKYDLGLTEKGSSGAPVFNSSKQIVGFHVAGDPDKSCDFIGQMSSTNGTFDQLYYEFNSILDPTGTGEATSSNPQPPSPSELPAHCRNCIRDEDETGIDCGGSCYPCGMQDVVTLKTPMDIPGTVKSRYDIFAEPDPGSLLALKSGSYSIEAGMNVYLKGGFEVEKGAAFYAGIDADLMSEPDRGCQNACINPGNIFTPNGDGVHDYLSMGQAFITEYRIQVFTSSNKLIYSGPTVPVHSNGVIYIWDGTGAYYTGTYQLGITYKDCFGNTHVDPLYYVYVGLLKSAEISDLTTDTTNETAKIRIGVYPNPFDDIVTVNYSGSIFPLEYKVTDLNGKEVLQNKTSSNRESINLSNLASGIYVINAKAGEYNLVQKLIKK